MRLIRLMLLYFFDRIANGKNFENYNRDACTSFSANSPIGRNFANMSSNSGKSIETSISESSNEKSILETSILDAFRTMNFHRIKMNEYLSNDFAVSTAKPSKPNSNATDEQILNGKYFLQKPLSQDIELNRYKSWLSRTVVKSTTRKSIIHVHEKQRHLGNSLKNSFRNVQHTMNDKDVHFDTPFPRDYGNRIRGRLRPPSRLSIHSNGNTKKAPIVISNKSNGFYIKHNLLGKYRTKIKNAIIAKNNKNIKDVKYESSTDYYVPKQIKPPQNGSIASVLPTPLVPNNENNKNQWIENTSDPIYDTDSPVLENTDTPEQLYHTTNSNAVYIPLNEQNINSVYASYSHKEVITTEKPFNGKIRPHGFPDTYPPVYVMRPSGNDDDSDYYTYDTDHTHWYVMPAHEACNRTDDKDDADKSNQNTPNDNKAISSVLDPKNYNMVLTTIVAMAFGTYFMNMMMALLEYYNNMSSCSI